MRKRFWKGLRTIELAIVLSIICIVVAVIAIRYPAFKCRSIQSEAKFSLEEIYAAQRQYHREHNSYATVTQLVDKDKRVILPNKFYRMQDKIEPTKDSFLITATGAPDTAVAGEVWTVNQYKEIRLDNAVCSK